MKPLVRHVLFVAIYALLTLWCTAQTISITPLSGGQLKLRIDAAPNAVYAVESTTRIPPAFWEVRALGTTDISGVIEWLDTNSVQGATRFYRAAAGSLSRPEATTASVQGEEDTLFVLKLNGSDPSNAALRTIVTALPVVGTLQQFDGAPILTAPATVSDSTGRLRFLAPPHGNGSPFTSFSYLVQRQGDGVSSSTKEVALNVTPVNDLPLGTVPPVQMLEDQSAIVQLSATDPDLSREGDAHTFEIVFAPVLAAMYQVENDGVTRGTRITDGDTVLNTNRLVMIELPAHQNGSPFETFTYQVTDSRDGKSPLHEVAIHVTPVNDPPTANNSILTVPGTVRQLQFNFDAQDVESSSEMILIEEISGKGRLYHSSVSPENEVTTTQNNPVANENLYFVVEGGLDCPLAGDHGTNYLTIKFKARDPQGLLSGQATLVFHVDPRVLPPYPTHSLSYTNQQNQTNRIELSLVDPQGLGVTRTITQLPQHGILYYGGHSGSASANPTPVPGVPVNLPVPPSAAYAILYYVPTNGFIGTDFFRYSANNTAQVKTCQPIQVDFTVFKAPIIQTDNYKNAGVYSLTVPIGMTNLTVKLWGAGGGGGRSAAGGGGGYASVSLTVSAGDQYAIVIGQRGQSGGANLGGLSLGNGTFGGAPGYLGDYNERAQGGQASSLFQVSSGTYVMKAVAGGGGGAGISAHGGGGGGGNGSANGNAIPGQGGANGFGGTGFGGAQNGGIYSSNVTALHQVGGNGGYAANWSGGGGGGYGGGSGGGGGTNGYGAGGGGGGSFGTITISGSNGQVGNIADPYYISPAKEEEKGTRNEQPV